MADRETGLLRRWRRRVERWARFAHDPAQWSADRYRRANTPFFAAVLKEAWRDPRPAPPESPTDRPGPVAEDPEPR